VVARPAGGISTIDHLAPAPEQTRPRRSWLHLGTTVALVVVVGMAIIDGFGWWDVYGVDTSMVRATGGGYELSVRYATVSRPALATPFEIDVTRAGGFDGPVTIAVDRAYLAMWDENGLVPGPSAETANGDWVEWEFDPPTGETLVVAYDARIEPGAQSGRDGAVAVVEDGAVVVSVSFHTSVRP
jgi:hypothetical protein